MSGAFDLMRALRVLWLHGLGSLTRVDWYPFALFTTNFNADFCSFLLFSTNMELKNSKTQTASFQLPSSGID